MSKYKIQINKYYDKNNEDDINNNNYYIIVINRQNEDEFYVSGDISERFNINFKDIVLKNKGKIFSFNNTEEYFFNKIENADECVKILRNFTN